VPTYQNLIIVCSNFLSTSNDRDTEELLTAYTSFISSSKNIDFFTLYAAVKKAVASNAKFVEAIKGKVRLRDE